MRGPSTKAQNPQQPAAEDPGPPPPPPPPPLKPPKPHVPIQRKSGWLLLRKQNRCPERLSRTLIGTVAQTLVWEQKFFELRAGDEEELELAFWSAQADFARGDPKQGVVHLADLQGLTVSEKQLKLFLRPQQEARNNNKSKRPQVCLRASDESEAEAWAAAIRSATTARLGAVLPSNWDVQAIVKNTSCLESEGLVNQELLEEDNLCLLQRFLDHAFVCKFTKDRRGNCLPLRLEVEEVVRVQNGHSWRDYCKARAKIMEASSCSASSGTDDHTEELNPKVLTSTLEDPHVNRVLGELEADANEQWLFHGTTSTAVQNIANREFRLDLAGTNRGTLYGKGVYMAECSTKADEYSQENEEGICTMLLCRASLGKMLINRDKQPDTEVLSANMASYDSLCGDRWTAVGTFREFICYDSSQVYPAYIIYYRRLRQPQLLTRLRQIAEDEDKGRREVAALDLIPYVAKIAGSHPDADVRYRISLVLSSYDTTAVPALIAALDDDRPLVRRSAAGSLKQLAANNSLSNRRMLEKAPTIAASVPALMKRLADKDESPEVRKSAAGTFESLGRHAAPAVTTLVVCLDDEDASVRCASAAALGQIGDAAAEAVPTLIRRMEDPVADVAGASANALGCLGEKSASAAPALVACLRDEEASDVLRREAAEALGCLGAAPVLEAGAVEALTGRLKDSDAGVRRAAVSTLGHLYPLPATVVSNVADCLRDRSAEVRGEAAKALGHLRECSTNAVPWLVNRGLKDPCDEVRLQAATALGHLHVLGYLGTHTDLVMQGLTERLKDTDSKVRKAANFGMTKPMTADRLEKRKQSKESVGSSLVSAGKESAVSSNATWRRSESQMKYIREAYSSMGH